MIDKEDEIDDTEEEIDAEGVEEGVDKTPKDKEDKDYRKVSLRETLKDAVEEHKEDEDKESLKKEKKIETKEENKEELEDNKNKEEQDKKVSTQPKLRPPPGWTKEGKSAWSSLAPDIQKSVIKREEEFSNGIAQYSTKAKAYDELDAVLSKRREEIKRFGVSEAQTIDRLFTWFEALSNPNVEQKLNAFKALADNFGADLSRFAPQQQIQQTNIDNQQDQNTKVIQEFNQALDKRFGAIDTKFQTWEQQLATQQQEAARRDAETFINNWSKDKPHFNKVRTEMFGLIQSGAVPLKQDGTLDLDTAYMRAVRANDEVYEIFKEEEAEKERQDALKKQKAEKDKLEKARRAGSSLKSSAPTGGFNGSQIKSKINGKTPTAGESIRAALAELRDTNQ